jgi:hypothetical protein
MCASFFSTTFIENILLSSVYLGSYDQTHEMLVGLHAK